uniref:Putative secreted peptide n=1 Tax=Anopheles braziliensis TaxID=58242 RepID=A0A2M3ZUA2_9DIPT
MIFFMRSKHITSWLFTVLLKYLWVGNAKNVRHHVGQRAKQLLRHIVWQQQLQCIQFRSTPAGRLDHEPFRAFEHQFRSPYAPANGHVFRHFMPQQRRYGQRGNVVSTGDFQYIPQSQYHRMPRVNFTRALECFVRNQMEDDVRMREIRVASDVGIARFHRYNVPIWAPTCGS